MEGRYVQRGHLAHTALKGGIKISEAQLYCQTRDETQVSLTSKVFYRMSQARMNKTDV